jgi:hypothetical protein
LHAPPPVAGVTAILVSLWLLNSLLFLVSLLFAGALLLLMSMHAASLLASLSLKHSFVNKLNNFLCLHKCIARLADFRDFR